MDLWIGTWNLNDKPPRESPGLSDWIPHDFKNTAKPAMIIIGVQELGISERSNWEKLVQSIVPEAFSPVNHRYMQPIGVFVFANLAAKELITDHTTDYVGTGLYSIMGNKGCCASFIRTKLGDLLFLSCHLRHGAERAHLKRRFQSSREIHFELLEYFKQLRSSPAIFLFGDLNYRVEGAALTLVEKKDWQGLFKFDQLTDSKNPYSVLFNASLKTKDLNIVYQEVETVSFPVTYKYNIGGSLASAEIDGDVLGVFATKRFPSWTDRILVEKDTAKAVKCLIYKSEDSVCSSDHKPVSAWIKWTPQSPDSVAANFPIVRRSTFSWILTISHKFLTNNALLSSGFVVLCAMILKVVWWKLRQSSTR
eukprot:TRINITY_DN5635_c0_g1_i1.p1 TRINITY_DN5635_c0_g1~~TRINITY_DN5635_c0_g1_i1.p1  ORF type:complete len:365 (-),score=88.12 TRINITY_DN5635_c0_g1_i1:73-1167(-)